MGRLVIAHHKSYHPYRADNIERVKQDEEEARLQEAKEEGRLRLAVRGLHSTTNTLIKTQPLYFPTVTGFLAETEPLHRTLKHGSICLENGLGSKTMERGSRALKMEMI